MIEARGLTKRYGDVLAVDDVSFVVQPGRATGFVGPNGSGKTTTLRLLLGLARPTAGSASVAGRPFAEWTDPLRRVGVMLDPTGPAPGRRAVDHLRWIARANDLDCARIDLVLDQVGLADVAGQPVGRYSLGMRQRLGIAAALLGDPEVLILDEPTNGLDVDGVRWIRELLRSQAAEGRTVLVSSHLLSELERTADHLLVLGRGRLLADVPMEVALAGLDGHQRLEDAYERLTAGAMVHRGIVR